MLSLSNFFQKNSFDLQNIEGAKIHFPFYEMSKELKYKSTKFK